MPAVFGDSRDEFGADAAEPDRFMDHQQATGSCHGGEHRVGVHRRDPAQIHDFNIDRSGQPIRSGEHFLEHGAVANDGDVGSASDDACAREANAGSEARREVAVFASSTGVLARRR